MQTKNYIPINLKLGREQMAALNRVAKERDVPRSVLIREFIAAGTGAPDTLQRHSRNGTRKRRGKNI